MVKEGPIVLQDDEYAGDDIIALLRPSNGRIVEMMELFLVYAFGVSRLANQRRGDSARTPSVIRNLELHKPFT